MKPNYLICEHIYSLLKDCIKDKDKKIYDCQYLLQQFNEKDCSIYGFKKPQIITLPLPYKPVSKINDDDWCLYLSSIFS